MPEVTLFAPCPPPALPASALTLRLLGSFDLQIGGQTVAALRTHKGEWLLALLVLREGRAVSREWLASVLWPDSPEISALYNLRRSLYDLRQALGSEANRVYAPSARTISLDLAEADVDVLRFDRACKQGQLPGALEEAVGLYGGPLLESCSEEWVLPERAAREQAYLNALEQLADQAANQRRDRDAIGLLKRVIAVEPLRESAYGSLMLILGRCGDIAAVTQVYRDLRVLLHAELNTQPSDETQEVYKRIREQPGATAAERPAPAVPASEKPALADVEPVGGAMPMDSSLYIERSTDELFHAALARRDSIVLLKGPRQVGKTSLLSRGLQQARTGGSRVIVTDLQKIDRNIVATAESFYPFLIRTLAESLELDVSAATPWDPTRSPNENLERFLRRHVLRVDSTADTAAPTLIWGLDEVDRLFTCPFGTDLFALFRSWHNERSFDPGGPWGRLTLAMAYATEAHLFITDLNQSPFNVGTRLTLDDFTIPEVARLNQLQGSPLHGDNELHRFFHLVGGHPYLIRRGLYEMITRAIDIGRLEVIAAQEAGPFTDHLQRTLFLLSRDTDLGASVKALLAGTPPPRSDFYRLRSAGVILGDGPETARIRCPLYRHYLQMHL